ncbi:bacterial Ig-like domain-containing protein, partial [Candidatus Enterococcus murrayae]
VDASQADTTKAGTFDVTYTYEGVTSTAKVTVKEKQTAVNVHDSTEEKQIKLNNKSLVDKKQSSLPETGENRSLVGTLLGTIMLAFVGLGTFLKNKKDEE